MGIGARDREKMTDDEAGAWERTWQRVYKALTRAGHSTAAARAEARDEAWRVVEEMRAGGAEPDTGRKRMPPAQRANQARTRRERMTVIYIASPVAKRAEAHCAKLGVPISAWVERLMSDAMR